MSIYKPKGNFQNEVVDPDRLSEEWTSAKRIVDNATSWQFLSQDASGLDYSTLASSGAGVRVLQKQRSGYSGAGRQENKDAPYLKTETSGVAGYRPWLIPYLKGYQEVWDGDLNLTWTSDTTELVLIGYSLWTYRLSSKYENTNNQIGGATVEGSGGGIGLDPDPGYDQVGSIYTGADFFGEKTQIRTKLGLKLDGYVVDGSGPGTNVATNSPEFTYGAGSREKGIVTSSQSLHIIRAGTHRVSPVAGQAPSTFRDIDDYFDVGSLDYLDDTADNNQNLGVGIINARIHVIRFPRGKMLGD